MTGIEASAPAPVDSFRAARDFLLAHRDNYDTAYGEFRWPRLSDFNWAIDWFDGVLAVERPDQPALWFVGPDDLEEQITFAELSARSTQLAGWLAAEGLGAGDRLLLVLGNVPPLWEVTLAAIKLGVVLIPATTLLGPADLADRVDRGKISAVVTASTDTGKFADVPGDYLRIAVGEPVPGWLRYADSTISTEHFDPVRTAATDPMLRYFTSGTTAQPKLVEHTQASYPVGHLSTMYWIGLQPGDVHVNISSPGWAKHAWSCVFAPWNAGATVLMHSVPRFSAPALLDVLLRCKVDTFCAPPTVWRMLVQEDLRCWPVSVRELVSAGEPLNPEVIEQVRAAWGITVRDGYGQTETTAQIGNSPMQPVQLGSMGRPLPGYAVTLLDVITGEPADEGEISLDLADRPMGLMTGYLDDPQRTDEVMRDGYYHTGDVAARAEDGYITYVGRADDVFKASDYRISPFELESVLIEHEAVAEAAVVPAPDPVRLAVPKAYVVLAAGHQPGPETALAILRHCRQQLAPYQRVRRIEFAELPKTISGKIRRVELRAAESAGAEGDGRRPGEYREEDFPDLRG
ncbi:MAG TPA: AMP-binding protein [Mycobacteriales bacterium]|nr:AMP-binding protein [Mycobacteriales bacterium]